MITFLLTVAVLLALGVIVLAVWTWRAPLMDPTGTRRVNPTAVDLLGDGGPDYIPDWSRTLLYRDSAGELAWWDHPELLDIDQQLDRAARRRQR